MPNILRVRAAQDAQEAHVVRQLAASRHGPADGIPHAAIVVRSWDGERVEAMAQGLRCSAQTVRRRLQRFDADGMDGLGDQPRAGRPRRVTAAQDSQIIAVARQAPPGRLVTPADGRMVADDEEGAAHWSLDALASAAQAQGIAVGRSQIRRLLRRAGVRWRTPHRWGTPRDQDLAPQGRRSSPAPRTRPQARRPAAPTNAAP
jgi:transposase